MKFILLIYFQCITLYVSAQDSQLLVYKKYFTGELKGWTLSYANFSLSDFRFEKTDKFDNNNPQDLKDLKSFYAIYKPILTFSKDSSRFIDIYSYQLNLERKGNGFLANPDIDQAVYLFDKKVKYWDRICFGSSGYWIEEATWVSNTKFILVCMLESVENKRVPRIVLGDAANQTLRIYGDANKSCIQRAKYRSPTLKRIPIEGL